MTLICVKELGLLLFITFTVDLQNLLIQISEFLVFSLRPTTLLKEENTVQLLSYEICKLSRNTSGGCF